MPNNPEPIKTERIDNSDGSYCIKNIYEDNTSEILTYNEQNLIISSLHYSDNNFEILDGTTSREYKKNKGYIQKDFYEFSQDDWQSIIGEYDKNKRLLSVKQFIDKDFTKPFIFEQRRYKLDGGFISKVVDFVSNRSAKRVYNKDSKLIKEVVYDDINFKKLLKIITTKYCANSHIIRKGKYFQEDWKHTKIEEFDEYNMLLSEYLQDEFIGKQFTEYKYTNGKLSEEKITYYKHNKISDIYKTTYKYENNKLVEEITQNSKKGITSFRTFEYLNNRNSLQKNKFPLKNESEIFLFDENNKVIESKYYNDTNFENLRVCVNTIYEPDGKEIQKAVYSSTNKTIKSVISSAKRMNSKYEITDYCYTSADFTELFATMEHNNLSGIFTRKVILEQPFCKFFSPCGNFDEYKTTNIYWQSCKEKYPIRSSIKQTIYYSDNNFQNSCCTSYRKFAKNETDTIFLNIYKNTSKNYLYEFEKYDKNMQLIVQKQYKYLGILAKLRFFLAR